MMRKPFIGGNWKMNTDGKSAVELAKGVAQNCAGVLDKVDVSVCPPFVYLSAVKQALGSSNIGLGAQDVYFEAKGAFTGEISCQMLKDVGCKNVLIGHSERRHVIKETNELINKKLIAAIEASLLPIFCVGELLEERKAEKTEHVVKEQIQKGMAGITVEKAKAVTIAYEPVWAIGTGVNATPAQAQEVHLMIRQLIASMYNKDFAAQIRIQYGGSAKPDNAAELMSQPDIDGLLVGGASLKADDFSAMVKAAAEAKK
ncbi:MAG: triose-phosphate isomerase [Planctomycetes bacterium HGW-Planctomycetes-1]|nr:MAG: triose-phosphate isomerase [Planctomycetes bacterium HGW-Planctomycetes-1]